jgi:RNA polymerase sigma-70 factor (ECF subfamily)
VAFAASRIQRDAAEDLAQEVLIVLQEKYPHVSRVEELVPLSLEIARFKILALRRKVVRRAENTAVSIDDVSVPDHRDDPEGAYRKAERIDRLKAALAGMGDRCRELMRLKLEGHSFPEIQAILGVRSINTVYTWDARCRRELLERLGGAWEKAE